MAAHNFRARPPPIPSIGPMLYALAALTIDCEREAARALASNDAGEVTKAMARIRGAHGLVLERLDPIAQAHASLATRRRELLPTKDDDRELTR